jgi:dihydrodipicolinate synthase/N-acetylneuraminate lyase
VTRESTRQWLRGPVVAVATPFNEDLSLDLEGAASNIAAMVGRGVVTGDGVLLVAAAAGEFPVLSIAERHAVIRASVRAADGRVPVMTSIQHTDVREVVDLVRFCADEGVAGVQLGPTYYYPATEGDLFRLIDAVDAAASIPIMAYATWWDGGVVLGPSTLRRLAEFERVHAVKWSAPDSGSYAAGIAAIADRLVVVDNHAIHIWGHLLGARAFVTHVGNFWPEWGVELWHELEAHDYGAATRRLVGFKQAWSEWAHRVASVTGGEGPFIKAALDLVGLRGGPPRPPSAPAPAGLIAELRELLARYEVPLASRREALTAG